MLPERSKFGTGIIWNVENQHNKIVPNFAMLPLANISTTCNLFSTTSCSRYEHVLHYSSRLLLVVELLKCCIVER